MTKYTKELLEPHVPSVSSFAELARILGLSPVGGTTTHLKRVCSKLGIDTAHFTGQFHMRGKTSNNRVAPEKLMVLTNKLCNRPRTSQLRRCMIQIGFKHECEQCFIGPYYNNKKLVLQIDHKNGKYWDNRKENLRFLCPNCHSQTNTFGKKLRCE